MKKCLPVFVTAIILLTLASGRAGVTVTQNTSVTNWTAGALVLTISNAPGTNATTAENNFGTANVAQTFTASTNIVLTNIQLFVSGPAQTFNLHLFDLGTGYAANSGLPSPYSPGTDLLSGIQLATATTGNGFVINLAFTGADQVLLGSGHKYAFELEKVSGGPMTWYRNGADTYANGDAYRDRALINGTKREFALAIFGTPTTNTSVTSASSCTVDWNTVYQRIDGFGASSAWQSTWTTAQGDMFFGTNNGTGLSKNGTNFSFTGAGFSLLRSRIAPSGTTVENGIMQMAQARGARVWSTPWSPVVTFKSNGNVNGGSFIGNPANYQAYANQLAGYVVSMKNTYGINLYALSLQNEPDANVTTYESCNWSAQQFHDFIPYLNSALVASNVATTKIMLPESQNWTDPSNLVVTAMSDSTSNLVSIVANHNYVTDNSVGDQTTPSAINSYGKARWETEVALLSGSDSSITNALYWAGRIHLFLTAAQANAWHYWWLMPGGTSGNQGLTDTNGVPAKRMYAMGQFSRFVRPNYYRINVTNNASSALISAYKDSNSPNFAIVAINAGAADITQTFVLTNFDVVTAVTPWLTTSNWNLTNQPVVSVGSSNFTYVLPALSIVTFTGQIITNTPPVLAAISNQSINAGFSLLLTNTATDTNPPAQILNFTLLSAPTNATLVQLNNSNALFSWRPLMTQAQTTNQIVVRVTDSGTPSLSATGSFTIFVNPLASPAVSTFAVGEGQAILTATGMAGPDYTLWGSTNLLDWQALVTSNSPSIPVSLVDTNSGIFTKRFYRIQIGP